MLSDNSLPVVSLLGNFGDANMLGFKMGIAGSIQIVSRTCSTPDVAVPMGTHLPKEFAASNSSSAWVDFSISLNNCPAFHGAVTKTPVSWVSQSGNSPSGTAGSVSVDNNSLQFRIDPTRTAVNAGNGVLSIEPSAAGRPPAASGIGLQIATQAATPVPLATKRSSGLTLSAFDRSYAIPLRARYLKTGASVTPGPANASATFTISYE
ncbi:MULTISPECIES: fimbrial protein [unclassified Janthinobacterium]|uniref:fimbrial protein n=1 Tax=unclassified Janthinobacterium TaxID=2610881 RepID=UPI0017EE4D46|nr:MULTISPECIES: fimbrial protein [unclassified Janthinobacterium]MBB5606392.1 type 1 fimbria pilin [Janthinobacterium sp. S3T4]MBB5611736.1 type 1 fimbria pilin [Janthinobacterium sp. S3M3]